MVSGKKSRQDFNQIFQREILSQLNKAQRKAVDLFEGPMLVLAGPGTGKTHVLAARVGNILLNTDTNADQVLCLTFSDAAVTAMRERLVKFIGPEGHRVQINTFHSFTNRIIQDHLELFGNLLLEPASELERVQVVRAILEQLPTRHPLRAGKSTIYFYEKHLIHLFRQMKLEGWSTKLIKLAIDEYLKDIKKRPEYLYKVNRGDNKKGDLKLGHIEKEKVKMETLESAAELFDDYQRGLAAIQRYDYEDMIGWVLDAFKKHPYLLRLYQEKYLYILVDEFQDTNGVQYDLIKQLIAYWEVPNLCIVGDDDQSIFEFQGARIQNMLSFNEMYDGSLEFVVLQENYRSGQPLLEVATELISINQSRLVNQLRDRPLSKSLQAQPGASPELVKIISYPNHFNEMVGILKQIIALKDQGVSLSEIAVIYAKHRQVESLVNLLEKEHIPYAIKQPINILEHRLIRQVLKVLKYAALETEELGKGRFMVFDLLHFDQWRIERADIEKVAKTMTSEFPNRNWDWSIVLRDPKMLNDLEIDLEAWLGFVRFTDRLMKIAANEPVIKLVEWVINQGQFLSLVLEDVDRFMGIQLLQTFSRFVLEEVRRKPRLSLKDLLHTIDQMEQSRITVPLNLHTSSSKGVQLLTAHSAKGLEFDFVFIIDALKEHWEPRQKGNAYSFSFPDTLTFAGADDSLEARRRLFFVAMTRAKKVLQISYGMKDHFGKKQQKAVFLDEISGHPQVEEKYLEVTEKETEAFLIQHITTPDTPVIHITEDDWLERRLAQFRLSASAMNQYLTCPIGFYYENIIGVPRISSEAAWYGTAVHYALYRLFSERGLNENQVFPGESSFIKYFEDGLEKERHYFSGQSFQRYKDQGNHHLKLLYRKNIKQWQKELEVKLEYAIREGEWEGVPLKGTIDKLVYQDKQAIIVDYKTGRQDPAKTRSATLKKPQGGRYWRQLYFYKTLFEAASKENIPAIAGQVIYIDPDRNGKLKNAKVEFDLKSSEIVNNLILDTYNGIMAHDFNRGCGELHCVWCNFVKEHRLTRTTELTIADTIDDLDK